MAGSMQNLSIEYQRTKRICAALLLPVDDSLFNQSINQSINFKVA